jgi:hypothetical protein
MRRKEEKVLSTLGFVSAFATSRADEKSIGSREDREETHILNICLTALQISSQLSEQFFYEKLLIQI